MRLLEKLWLGWPSSLATIAVASDLAINETIGWNMSTPYYDYGSPLRYRRVYFLSMGMPDEFDPLALSLDLVFSVAVLAATCFATRRWFGSTQGKPQFSLRALLIAVVVCSFLLWMIRIDSLLLAVPLLAVDLFAAVCCVYTLGRICWLIWRYGVLPAISRVAGATR